MLAAAVAWGLAVTGCAGDASDGSGGNPGPEPTPAASQDCSSYVNQSGYLWLSITVHNGRESDIFVKPFLDGCNDVPRVVRVVRDGEEVRLENPYRCAAASCEQLQDGSHEPLDCTDACSNAELVRLVPGGEIELGPFMTEFVSHGILPGTAPMPVHCVAAPEQYAGSCYAEAPVALGRYELTAQAAATCPEQGACDCRSNARGVCTTGALVPDEYQPLVGGLVASAVVESPSGEVVLTFR